MKEECRMMNEECRVVVASPLVGGGAVRRRRIRHPQVCLLRPSGAWVDGVSYPRVALRSTRGYGPSPLRGGGGPQSSTLRSPHGSRSRFGKGQG